jgi:N-dimethylarginine dimethylaminohydrolase
MMMNLATTNTSPTIAMIPPTFFSVDYAINPWMNPNTTVDVTTALTQWQHLKQTLTVECGATIVELPPVAGLPDMVFVANAAVVLPPVPNTPKRVLLARFLDKERQGEEPYLQHWFETNGYIVEQLPPYLPLEGAGEALAWQGILFASYGQRAVYKAHSWLTFYSMQPVISLELIDPRFYHLDVAFCPTDLGYVLYYPEAFSADSLALLETIIPTEKCITVTTAEALQFACNAVSVGKHIVLPCHAPILQQHLVETGHIVHVVPYTEMIKAGGATKCSTLRLLH